jgi:hypothetical protein
VLTVYEMVQKSLDARCWTMTVRDSSVRQYVQTLGAAYTTYQCRQNTVNIWSSQ